MRRRENIRAPVLWGLVGSAVALGGCQPQLPEGVWIRPDVAEHLVANQLGEKVSHPIWRDGSFAVGVRSEKARVKLKTRFEDQTVVMVSIPPGSSYASKIKKRFDPLLQSSPRQNRSGYALVPIKNKTAWEDLARNAHSHEGFSCGRLQTVDFGLLPSEISLAPPAFSGAVPLQPVKEAVQDPQRDRLEQDIKTLEAMGTRFHTRQTGREAPGEIATMFENAAGGRLEGFQVETVPHDVTEQKSVVATLPGTDSDASTVVVGAHLDSINRNGEDKTAPGADDDASGIATMLEAVRVIASRGLRFRRTLEFHGYAAEEVGLVGSGEIAASYADEGRSVAAMMQLDMNAYSADPSSTTIHLVRDDTSFTVRRFVSDLIDTYLGGDWEAGTLPPGATSDHKSWTSHGFAAVFPFEDPEAYNQSLHTADDTFETINNMALTRRFTQLVVAFLAHHGGITSVDASTYEQARTSVRENLGGDLKLAIEKQDEGERFHVFVAAPKSVAAVELCPVDAKASMRCSDTRRKGEAAKNASGRRFFLGSSPVALSDGSRLAVFGYDENGALAAQRTVRLEDES